MKFHIIKVFTRAVTIELDNTDVYQLNHDYEIYLNDKLACTTRDNVVTLFSLLPSNTHSIRIDEDEKTFRTKNESVLLNVREFGALGDGKHLDTHSLQAAILSCPEDGTVYVPKGTYFTTPLFLKSHMTLYLEEGATLLGDTDRTHYPILPGMTMTTDEEGEYNLSSWEGNPLTSYASLLTAIDVEDLNVIGQGTINGNADQSDWWTECKIKRGAWRPNTIFLCRVKHVSFAGVTVKNSPCWTIHPYYSDHLAFLNLTISNPYNSPNTDGFDPESCQNVLLLGTKISVGDDCIAIKSGKYYMAMNHLQPSTNIVIRNCLLERGHGSVTIGSEIAGGVKDVHVSQCIFSKTDRGIRVKTRRGRGETSVLDKLHFENIKMDGVHMPLTVNMFYFCDPDGHSDYVQNQNPQPVDQKTPRIGTIEIENVTCTNADACIACAYGLPEMPIEKITLRNVEASFRPSEERTPQSPIMMDHFEALTGKSFYFRNVNHVELNNVHVAHSSDNKPTCINVQQTDIENLMYQED